MAQVNEVWLNHNQQISRSVDMFVSRLKSHLKNFEPIKVVGNRSAVIRELVSGFTPGEGFLVQNNSINPESSGNVPAGHRVDCMFLSELGHYIAVELCLNNRETIGTNFMKLSASLDSREGNLESLALLITLSRGLLDFGGWDKSYGDTDEYLELFKIAYGRYFHSSVLILSLDV